MIVGAYYGWQNIDTNNDETYFQFIDDFFPGQPFNPPIGSADAIGSGLFDPTQPITGIYAKQHFIQVSRSKAIYGEATSEISDAFSRTFGARSKKDYIKNKKAEIQLS